MSDSKNFRFKLTELGKFNSESADNVLNSFSKDCRIMGITRGKFSLIDLIHSVLKITGAADVVCVTWSAGIKDAHQIEWMQKTRLIKSFQIVTDRSYETRQPKYAVAISDLFGQENIRVTDIHAKFVLISNENFRVCIRTSMNLNANKTCENFEIDENAEIFEFYHNFVKDILREMPEGWDGRRGKVEEILDRIFNEKQEKSLKTIKKGGFKKMRRAFRTEF
jgi:hypothetical protein